MKVVMIGGVAGSAAANICQGGLRSYIAGRILMGNGFDAYNFAGGYRFFDTVHSNKA